MKQTSWVRRDVVLVLIALALGLPRLSAAWSGAVQAEVPSEKSQAAVGYAKHRLWSEFLRQRSVGLETAALPAPTLAEYRQFLAGLGLKRRGDAASLVVLPVVSESRLGRLIEVRLSQAHPPLVLKLYVPGGTITPLPVGTLEIRVDPEGVVSCLAATESEPKLFSYWPVRPLPLLP